MAAAKIMARAWRALGAVRARSLAMCARYCARAAAHAARRAQHRAFALRAPRAPRGAALHAA